MRKLVLALGALAAIGIALPVVATTSASAETVIIKRGNDRAMHRGWDRGRHYGWNRGHRDRVVVIKRQRDRY